MVTSLSGNQFIWGHTRLGLVNFESQSSGNVFTECCPSNANKSNVLIQGSHQAFVRISDYSLSLFFHGRKRENYDKLSVKCDIQINVAKKRVSLNVTRPVSQCITLTQI